MSRYIVKAMYPEKPKRFIIWNEGKGVAFSSKTRSENSKFYYPPKKKKQSNNVKGLATKKKGGGGGV
jgi:hypothetical protein